MLFWNFFSPATTFFTQGAKKGWSFENRKWTLKAGHSTLESGNGPLQTGNGNLATGKRAFSGTVV
jgi:hypothetical protein